MVGYNGISVYDTFFLRHSMYKVCFMCIISFNTAYEVSTFIIPLLLIRKPRKGFAQGYPVSLWLSQDEAPVLKLRGQAIFRCSYPGLLAHTAHLSCLGDCWCHRQTFGFLLASLINLPISGHSGPSKWKWDLGRVEAWWPSTHRHSWEPG